MFGHAIVISFALLIYKGKRWRFAFQSIIVAILFIPTFAMGTPFDVLARMPLILFWLSRRFYSKQLLPNF
jgi:hypothetical protein